MLVKVQLYLEEKQIKQLEEMSELWGVSTSEAFRRIFDAGIKIMKKKMLLEQSTS